MTGYTGTNLRSSFRKFPEQAPTEVGTLRLNRKAWPTIIVVGEAPSNPTGAAIEAWILIVFD
jgi:hypothetical protein